MQPTMLHETVYNNLTFWYNTYMNKQLSISFDKASSKYICNIAGTQFKTKNSSYVEYMHKKLTGQKVTIDELMGESKKVAEVAASKFTINQRFEFVEKLVNMVASGVQPSAVITGQGGLGKTYTVTKTLENAGYVDMSKFLEFEEGTRIFREKSYVSVKGYSTPKGLYRTLFENNGSVIIFDDCDSVLKDPIALNLLKGALDSYGKRIISWNADMRDDDLPRSFNFTGKVIFISNYTQDKIDQAIRSRSMMIDLTMTDDQKIDRMEYIAKSEEFMPEYDLAAKTDAVKFIRKVKDQAKEISLRTLISVTKIRSSNENWEDLAEYVLCN